MTHLMYCSTFLSTLLHISCPKSSAVLTQSNSVTQSHTSHLERSVRRVPAPLEIACCKSVQVCHLQKEKKSLK